MNSLCSHERLELALAGSLHADDEAALHLHLEECESCFAEMARLSGGEQASREVAAMLVPDDFYDAAPLREECSTADFVVDHLEPSDDPAVLGRLGGYDVLDIIGRGGMGVVLKGYDRELKRFVAIKALAPHLAHSALARKRFAREAQAAAAVVNLHVIAIHQVQPNGPLPFLVMPLLTGESLAQRLKARGTLELKEILRIGMQAAEGLAAAHGQGLIHRDVKPANILLEKGVERAVLTDFGLARAADDVSMTRWGIIAGTPEYMSPEQARGEALDGRSDLFSLGCVLYEMATGVSPFRTDSTMATLRRIVDEKPAAMASLVPELPPWFCHIVERLLSKDPAQRFASASEVSQLLEQCLSHLQQPTAVALPSSLSQPRPMSVSKRHKNLFTGVLVMFATLVLGLVAMFAWQGGSPLETSDDSLDGVWEVALEPDSVEPPDDQRLRFVFAGYWYGTFRGSERLSVSRFKVDPEHTPKRISLVDGDGKSKRGIYEIKGAGLRLSLALETDALPTMFGPDLKRANGNLAQAQLAALKLYSTKATANKADDPKATPQYVRQVPRHKLVVTCFIGEVDSKSNCSTKCFGEDGVPNQSGKMICGFPGKAAEIEWKFLGYVGDKDVYEFTVVAPRGSPDATTTKTEVEFAGRRMPVLRDSDRVIVMDSLETKAQGSPPEQPAESQPKTTNAAPDAGADMLEGVWEAERAINPQRGTLSGRFVYDGEPPTQTDLLPSFAKIDVSQPQQPGPDVRLNDVEAVYRDFIKHKIRPKTEDVSLIVSKDGGIANVVVWVVNKDIPWSPPKGEQPPVTIRLKDGNFSPRFAAVTVGQSLSIENHDPLSLDFAAEFSRALNPSMNLTLPPGTDNPPQRVTFRAPEPYPTTYRSNQALWASGRVFVHGNPFVAVSQPDGSFTLPNLPTGDWEFQVWHERGGFLQHWPKGRFQQSIKPGDNKFGTIKLKPEHLGQKPAQAIATTPPPKNREQIGEVLGKPVYRDEVKDDTLNGIFLNPVLAKYRGAHSDAISPKDDEIKFATEFFDKQRRKQLDGAGGEAKIREQMKALEERLARTDLTEDDEKKLELEHLGLRQKLRPPGRFFAEFMLNNWKFQKHLYDEFGGGRILFQQGGLEAFDATRTCLESLEKKGEFRITDAQLRAKLYEYWTRSHGFFLTDDKERIRKEFLEPGWIAPAAAKARRDGS